MRTRMPSHSSSGGADARYATKPVAQKLTDVFGVSGANLQEIAVVAGHVMRELPLERRRDLPLDISALA